LLVIPVVMILATAVSVAACRTAGINPHVHDLMTAAGICLIAAEVGIIPLLRIRHRVAIALFQAAFLGTVLHLTLEVLLGGIVLFWLKPSSAFIYWLLASYWLTLLGLCAVFVRALRATANPNGTPSK
jgi:hypothetical protein